MKRCAYLTMADPSGFVMDYPLSIEPMQTLGWQVVDVVWNDPTADWDAFDAVYICTPWDYQDDAARFVSVLETIDRSKAVLLNDLELVRWNLVKTYLRDLEARGVQIVPSRWFDCYADAEFGALFGELDAQKLVVKPQVGANADATYVLEAPPDGALRAELETVFATRPFFVQPFLSSIVEEGEYSLFFFNNEYSHAILKTPKAGDFRSQEEHGAQIDSAVAAPALIDIAEQVMACVEPVAAYARVDLLRDDAGRFRLMELEIIEPSLYLRTDPGAPGRFAAAFDQRFQVLAGK